MCFNLPWLLNGPFERCEKTPAFSHLAQNGGFAVYL
jgi:hypothetical protein